jgi:hypothetical protein
MIALIMIIIYEFVKNTNGINLSTNLFIIINMY